MDEQSVYIHDASAQELDLLGEFERALDAKGRLSLPSSIKDELSGSLCVFPAPDVDALYVYQRVEFTKWINRLFEQRGGFNERKRGDLELRRGLKAMARPLEIDAAGRICLTEDMRTKVGLGRKVVVVGNTDHIEIWDAAKWETKHTELMENMTNLFFDI